MHQFQSEQPSHLFFDAGRGQSEDEQGEPERKRIPARRRKRPVGVPPELRPLDAGGRSLHSRALLDDLAVHGEIGESHLLPRVLFFDGPEPLDLLIAHPRKLIEPMQQRPLSATKALEHFGSRGA